MTDPRTESVWVVAGEASGKLEAEILRGMLESLGFHVRLSQESAGAAVGLSVGPLGTVELLVPEDEEPAAKSAIDDYFSGKSMATEDQGSEISDQ
jgi:hypothetical protein